MAGRTLGYALLAGAGVLALLMLAWLAVGGARGGGIVLGLILLVVLAGPLAIGGLVVLSRQPTEAAAEAAFANKRRILDADRLFRRELAPELRQLARQPALPGQRILELAEDLERSSYDSAEWYDAVQLTDEDLQTLKRYDDLAWDRVRRLRDRANAGAPRSDLERGVGELEQALDQRRDLVVRGRRAPDAAPSQILRAGAPRRGLDALRGLTVGDAVTSDGTDYVVAGVAAYFAEGQTWRLIHLSPAGDESAARWLYVGPAALELALLDEVSELPPTLQRVASGTATVTVESQAGAAQGVLVTFSRFTNEHTIGLAEEWPDGTRHAYQGGLVSVDDLEVWPASRTLTQRDPSVNVR